MGEHFAGGALPVSALGFVGLVSGAFYYLTGRHLGVLLWRGGQVGWYRGYALASRYLVRLRRLLQKVGGACRR